MKLPRPSSAPASQPAVSRKNTEVDEIRSQSRHAYQMTFAIISVAAAVLAACVIAEMV